MDSNPWLLNKQQLISVQFSPLADWVVGGREGRFSRDPVPIFFCMRPSGAVPAWAEEMMDGQMIVVNPSFLLPTTASPTLQGALKDGFGEAVVANDVLKPCEFLRLLLV